MNHSVLKDLSFSKASEYNEKMDRLNKNLNRLKYQRLFAYLLLAFTLFAMINFPYLPVYAFVIIFIFPVLSVSRQIKHYEHAIQALKESVEDFDFYMH
ncbi:hypothetical protein SAMN03080615_03958 [Amphritea atlantica]|uniref:Uncharacterized protein n=1 Tax=Amphritea atlantica TaxID=355243 RepID=A0A1H9LIG9_9GAMM|nr:hypothetical protein [Amphritea atlantica]SER10915.1 hypothetical protein SAMN03080615_03958 [Amphritea atlantica]